MLIRLEVNGEERTFERDAMTPLLDVLRDTLFLKGAKDVCREGFCGACMVHVDGAPVASCLMPVGLIGERPVVTIEGLGCGDDPTPLQRALEELDAVQCGMCFPGMVMSLTRLLEDRPAATRDEIRRGLAGNICRCTGYERIVDAVLALHDGRGADA